METNLIVSKTFKIYNNTANEYAHGIYNEGNLYVADQRDITNGVYIYDRNAVAKIISELPEGSAIQIDNSNYVYPDPNNSPIVIAEATNTYPILNEDDRNAFIKPPTGFENWAVLLANNDTQVVLALLAPDEYTITYEDLYEATNPNPEIYKTEDLPITLLPPGQRTGYTFIGWYDALGNEVTIISEGTTGDLILYARWQRQSLLLSYNGNDTQGSRATGIPGSVAVNYGDNVYVSDNIPTRPGFIFAHWNTKSNGKGISYNPKDLIENFTDNMVLYAIWIPIMIPHPVTKCNKKQEDIKWYPPRKKSKKKKIQKENKCT